MHHAALKAAGLEGEYKEYAIASEQLEGWLQSEAPKLDGFNVTMPHKEAVFEWISRHGKLGAPFPELIRNIGAVNTVKVEAERLVGFNTDGAGFLEPLEVSRLKGKKVLLLGAGGSAQAIAVYVAHAGQIGSLKIWNRHFKRAERLAEKVRSLAGSCEIAAIREIEEIRFSEVDLVIQTTPAGMKGEADLPLPYDQLHDGQIVYDIVYQPRETRLIREAAKRGCRTITGDKMLAGQAAESFKIWTGVDGMLPVMQEALDEHYSKSLS